MTILIACEATIMVLLPLLFPGALESELVVIDALSLVAMATPILLWRLGHLAPRSAGAADDDGAACESTLKLGELEEKSGRDRRQAGAEALAAGMLISAVAALALIGAVGSAEEAVTAEFAHDMGALAAAAASTVDLELHDRITDPAMIDGPEYDHLAAPLRRIANVVPGVKYVYTTVLVGDTIRFVVDAAEPGDNDQDGVEDRAQVWEAYDDADDALRIVLQAAPWIGEPGEADPAIACTGEPYTDKWGTFVSAYAPLRGADGRVVAALGLDVSAAHFEATVAIARQEAIFGGIPAAFLVLAGVVGIYATRRRMLTNQARLRTVLIESERLAEIARRTNNSVVVTDGQGRIEWVNPGFTRLTGYELDEVRGRKPGSFLQGPDSDPAQIERMRGAVARLEPVSVEIVNYSKSGRSYVVSIDIQVLRDGAGRLTGFMAIQSDVTEKHEAKRRIMEAMRAAEDANQAKSEFLANMSHEIRTPLTAILGYADLLGSEIELAENRERRNEAVATIRGAGRHLLAILNDILDISKIDAGRMTVERVATDLPAILIEVARLCRSRALDKKIEFDLVLEAAIPDRIHSDPTRLRQILFNLVGNAIKFTSEGSVVIRVNTSAAGTRLQVAIEDSGPGLSAEQAERLFQPFTQADASVTRRHGGTGLGLVISRRLARLLGGDVTLARSESGRGSTFQIELPLEALADSRLVTSLSAPEPKNPPSAAAAVDARPGRLSGRFLVAEDGADNQLLLSFILRKAGAEVELADNGRIALEMIEASAREGRPYDLLLSDMQMPEMDGYTLARCLRDQGNDLPIIALTAHAMSEDRQKCLDAGCDDYVSKPVDRPALLATCARLLAEPSA